MAPRNGIDLDAVRRGVGMWYEANVNAQGDQEAEDQEDEGLEDESQEDEDQENDDQEAENQTDQTEGQTNRDERQVHFDDTQNVLVEYTIPQGATMRPFRSGRRRRGSDAGGAEAGPAGDVPDEEQPREGREERAADTPEDEPAEEEDTSGQEMAQVFGRFDPEIEAIENDLTVGQLEESPRMSRRRSGGLELHSCRYDDSLPKLSRLESPVPAASAEHTRESELISNPSNPRAQVPPSTDALPPAADLAPSPVPSPQNLTPPNQPGKGSGVSPDVWRVQDRELRRPSRPGFGRVGGGLRCSGPASEGRDVRVGTCTSMSL